MSERIIVGQINIQSFYAKKDMLVNYLANNNMNVVLISETWERVNKTLNMRGYRFLSKPRSDGYGGVAILYRNSMMLQQVPLPAFEVMEAVAALTTNLERNLLLVSVYITQARDEDERKKALSDFKKLFEWVRGKSDLIVCGDMNAHARIWGCLNNCARGNQLADLIQDSDMVILNDGRTTRMANVGGTASAIDLSMTSIGLASRVTWNVEQENLGGDHFMIKMIMNDNRVFRKKREIMNNKRWVEQMNEILGEGEINQSQLDSEIERVNKACVKFVDMKEINVNGWWNNEVQFWYERKRIALREFNRNRSSENKIMYGKMNGKLKKAIRRAKRKSWREYVSQMTHRTTTKDVWNLFNRVNGKHFNASNVVCENREKGNEFIRMILNVSNSLNISSEIEGMNKNKRMDRKYEWDEFIRVLDNSKSTTPGTNRVSYRMIQLLSQSAKHNLLDILNKVWMSSKIPNKWKESRVVPIPKRDRDSNVATNYRGICMLNVFIKILNGMMKERMESFMNENNLLPSTTFGFRKNHSAIECVEKFVWEVRKDNIKVVAVFLDIERAYDYVVPWKLQQILSNFGFSRKVCMWIKDFMSERKIVLNGSGYRLEGVANIGLPQGSKISPALFNLYTSEIHRINTDNQIVLQFADDFVVIGKGRSIDAAAQKAQKGVDDVMEKFKMLNLQVNPNKCAYMSFRTNDININIKVDNNRIEHVNAYRYLGIWIDRRMNFGKHMKILADNCKERINVIKRVSKPKWGAHPGVTDMLRKALISSKIGYGISVYGNGSKGAFCQLMKVENACARVVLGAINSTPIHTLWSEMGDSPLDYRREWITVRETVRMITRNNEFWNEMVVRLQSRAVYKPTYRTSIALENMNIFLSIGNAGPQPVPNSFTVCLNMEEYSKGMNEVIAKIMFSKISRQYLQHEIVYTDASVSENGVGVGIFMPNVNKEKCFRVDKGICIMNAELIGIYEGIKLAVNEGNRKIVIFSDSKSGLCLLKCGGERQGNVYVDLIFEYVRVCQRDVTIQWVPSHRQIEGNERADMLAKKGTLNDMVQEYEKMDARDVLRMLQMNLWRKWENEYNERSVTKGMKYKELCETPLRTPFYKELKGDTRMLRTIERVRLNHGNWKECLWKRRLSQDKECEMCGSVEDVEHLILVCPKYNQCRSMFNVLRNARNLTRLMNEGGLVYREMYEFIRMSGITI